MPLNFVDPPPLLTQTSTPPTPHSTAQPPYLLQQTSSPLATNPLLDDLHSSLSHPAAVNPISLPIPDNTIITPPPASEPAEDDDHNLQSLEHKAFTRLIRQLTYENTETIDVLARRARDAPTGTPGDQDRLLFGTTWLVNNYEWCEGFNIPRQDLYDTYKKYCELNNVHPTNSAYFGKIVKMIWPDIKTRRLGTRGQSKYHYTNIRVKGAQYTAAQLHSVQHPFAALVMSGVGNMTLNPLLGDANSMENVKLGEFPTIMESYIPLGANIELIQQLLVAYKQHSQTILEALQLLQFPQIELILRGFWTSLPDESRRLMNTPEVTEIIWRCDSILYDTVMNQILPSPLHQTAMPITQAVRHFARQFESWILLAMDGYYPMLVARKVEVAKVFTQQLKRHTSLNFLAQAAVQVLESADLMHTMFIEWSKLDFEGIKDQAAWVTECRKVDVMQIAEMEIKNLLTASTKLEQWIVWLDSVIIRFLDDKLEPSRYIQQARQYILKWSFYGNLVMRDLTLRSMSTFGSFHIMRMFIDEYIFYVVEQRIANAQSATSTYMKPSMSSNNALPSSNPSS